MKILVLQMGGMGDLVLTADLVWRLKRARPETEVVLACRSGRQQIAELYPVIPDQTLALEFNPYCWAVPSPQLLERLRPALDQLRALGADYLVAADLAPTWFSWAAAAALEVQAAAGPPAAAPAGLLPLVLKSLRLERREMEGPEVGPRAHERERYRALARHLGAPSDPPPLWRLPEEAEQAAEARRRALGLERGRYLACFPEGTANVAIKRWPPERYAAALRAFQQEHPLKIVLMGNEAEADRLAWLRERLEGPAAVFAGGPGELPVLAGLLAGARAWLGNDSGPMHLAQAYGTPGVALFGGGGRWEAYAPWGRGTLGVVHHLPCFGCSWDCLFGHAVCLEQIPAAAVVESLRRVMADGNLAPQWVSAQTLSSDVLKLVEDAGRNYREAQRDRQERLERILELMDAAEERLAALELVNAELERLRAGK
jgi:ADP-heptose:LPS heptosyltransferase